LFRSSGPFTLAECEEMVVRKLAHRVAHRFGWSLGWEGDTCVGWGIAQYCIVDGFSEVEIGWTVARSHWRRGIASRLGEHALNEVTSLGLRGVIAYTREDNVASRGVMAKLGTTYEKSLFSAASPPCCTEGRWSRAEDGRIQTSASDDEGQPPQGENGPAPQSRRSP
jgi:GNAT superfamily N-acetyltransferase